MAQENDIVLIYQEDIPISFARIENFKADHKKDWFHVKLLLLQIPLQVVTWILRDIYIDGEEFTMGGKRMRLEYVQCPEEPLQEEYETQNNNDEDEKKNQDSAKVISLSDLKKK